MSRSEDSGVPEATETGDPDTQSGAVFRRVFAPELWGEAQRFVRFALHSFEFDKAEAAALEGVVGHFGKAMALTRVGRRLQDGLEADGEEAMTRGYSDAKRSEEFAAVVEEIFGELYACLDTMRQVLKVVYPKAQGIPGKTSRLFFNAAEGKLDREMIPEPIRAALADVHRDWLAGLRRIRTGVISQTSVRETASPRSSAASVALADVVAGQAHPDGFCDPGHSSMGLAWVRIRTGMPGPLPSPEEALGDQTEGLGEPLVRGEPFAVIMDHRGDHHLVGRGSVRTPVGRAATYSEKVRT